MMQHRGPYGKFGDLLPLPPPRGYAEGSFSGLSRRVSQRLQRKAAVATAVGETVRSLNFVAGFRDPQTWPTLAVNLAQSVALGRIWLLHGQEQPAEVDASDEAALRKLLKTGGGSYGASPGGLARYSFGALSLPRDQVSPADPLPWLEGVCKEAVAVPERHMLLSDRDRGVLLDGADLEDQFLRKMKKRNAHLISRLFCEIHMFFAHLQRFNTLRSEIGVY